MRAAVGVATHLSVTAPPALIWPDAQGSRRAAARLEALTRQHDALLEGFRNPRPTLLHQRLSERRGRSR